MQPSKPPGVFGKYKITIIAIKGNARIKPGPHALKSKTKSLEGTNKKDNNMKEHGK